MNPVLTSFPHATRWTFSLTDDQRLIRDTVRQFMDAEVRPTIRGTRPREEKFASAELRKLGGPRVLRHVDSRIARRRAGGRHDFLRP